MQVDGANVKIYVQPSTEPRLRDRFKREVALNARRAFEFVGGMAKGTVFFAAGAVSMAASMPLIQNFASAAYDLAQQTYALPAVNVVDTQQKMHTVMDVVGLTAMGTVMVAMLGAVMLPQHVVAKRYSPGRPHGQGVMRPSWILGAAAGVTLFFTAEHYSNQKMLEMQSQVIEQLEEMFRPQPAPEAPKIPTGPRV